MLEVGSEAPDFTTSTQHGDTVSLSEYRGKKVVLYFFPTGLGPGCVMQACNLRDNIEHLSAEGIVVLGCSGDTAKSNGNFSSKYNLPYSLVADPDREIASAYGTYGEKKMFGHTHLGIKRTTYLIDEEGVILHIIRRPKLGVHAHEILKAFGL